MCFFHSDKLLGRFFFITIKISFVSVFATENSMNFEQHKQNVMKVCQKDIFKKKCPVVTKTFISRKFSFLMNVNCSENLRLWRHSFIPTVANVYKFVVAVGPRNKYIFGKHGSSRHFGKPTHSACQFFRVRTKYLQYMLACESSGTFIFLMIHSLRSIYFDCCNVIFIQGRENWVQPFQLNLATLF